MAVCQMCYGCGFFAGDVCPCKARKDAQRKAYFAKAKKAKPAAQYAFPKAHKCGPETQEFLHAKGGKAFYLCECGTVVKTEA